MSSVVRDKLVELLSAKGYKTLPELTSDSAFVKQLKPLLYQIPNNEIPYIEFLLSDFLGRVNLFSLIDNIKSHHSKTILIIGSGINGLYTALKLQKMGFQVNVLCNQTEVGGTWQANRYPGCRVDVTRAVYPFSDIAYSKWSDFYPTQDEVLQYCRYLANQLQANTIQLNTEVNAIEWQSYSKNWLVTAKSKTNKKQELECDFLIDCTGQLAKPKRLKDELISFKGDVYYATEWPESVKLENKSVALIGNAASGIQIASTIADQVSQLHIVQGSTNWIREVEHLKTSQPIDTANSWQLGFDLVSRVQASRGGFAALKDPELHQKLTSECYHFMKPTSDRIGINLIPDYQLGMRRILLDNGDFLKAIEQSNVQLYNDRLVSSNNYELILASGQRLQDIDIVILAIGFDIKANHFPYRVGIKHAENRSDITEQLLGLGSICFSDLPNFFQINGFGTNVVLHGSATMIAEVQVAFTAAAILNSVSSDLPFSVSKIEEKEYERAFKAANTQLLWSKEVGRSGWYWDLSEDYSTNIPFSVGEYIDLLKTFMVRHQSNYKSEQA